MNKIPELFQLIIQNDNSRAVIVQRKVISDSERKIYKELRETRKSFTVAAQNFIKRQRGNSGGSHG